MTPGCLCQNGPGATGSLERRHTGQQEQQHLAQDTINPDQYPPLDRSLKCQKYLDM
jgi:hypothetical protein